MPGVLLAVLVGLGLSQLGLLCTTIYLHRALSHRSITLRPWVESVFRVLIWLMTGIRPRQWAAVHRKHHAFTDVDGDPHSPVLLGFWRVQLTNAALYRKVARDGVTVQRYAKDLAPDRWDKVLFDHAFLGLGIGIGFLCLVLGWKLGLIAAAVHALSYLALNAAINAVGHSFGKKSYANTAFNNQWLAFVTGGEGLHNNHHAAPTSAKLALGHHELDPAWWVIRLMVLARMAKLRLKETRFVQRSAPSVNS
ncbi:MAG: fatty acid desaturase [Acidimicrobiales bacterium]